MPRGGFRPGAGRPRKPDDERKHEPMPTKHTPQRLDAYREAAARAGVTLSEWVEIHLDKAASR